MASIRSYEGRVNDRIQDLLDALGEIKGDVVLENWLQ